MGVVDEFVSALGQSEDHDSEYECQQCGSQYGVQYHQCPDCESYQIERNDWEAVVDK